MEKELSQNTKQTEEMDCTVSEVKEILKENWTRPSLATMVVTLKRQLTNSEKEKIEIQNNLKASKIENSKLIDSKKKLLEKVSTLESENGTLRNKLQILDKFTGLEITSSYDP